ncbi:MAG: hypothetical protein PHZ02_00365 [Desulfocapsaceae bacterium]|nr:hypothetical protein [Desulfocapsaceae bacterium]
MIGQMTGVVPLTGTERVQRSSVSGADSTSQEVSLSSMQGGVDNTSFSPAALAMAKNVPPVGESAEMGKTGPNESENVAENSLEKRIDIRV